MLKSEKFYSKTNSLKDTTFDFAGHVKTLVRNTELSRMQDKKSFKDGKKALEDAHADIDVLTCDASIINQTLGNDAGQFIKDREEIIALKEEIATLLPIDNVVATEFSNDAESKVVASNEIPADWEGVDIGPETVKLYGDALKNAKTVIWNGPMGVFEFDKFAVGTNEIAKILGGLDAITIIGGGDSAAAIEKGGFADKMTHISTGGGASLEFLEGKELPGIACLLDK